MTGVPLAVLEAIVADSGLGETLEALLPTGVRHRQLPISTLLVGMLADVADGRPAHLTRVLDALRALPADDQKRLGVLAEWKSGPHLLTYRQVEHTASLLVSALAKAHPDGAPSPRLQQACDRLLEASIPAWVKQSSRSLAVDWTDVESWSRPVPADETGAADPEARWGHRNVHRTIELGDRFFGYYLSGATMVADENGRLVPELARRMTLCSSAHDPAGQLAGVLSGLPAEKVTLGDVLADSGYAYRVPDTWANPLRAAGAQLIQDLHPADRGPHGTHQGAIICNGNLYCPKTPQRLLQLIPLPPGASTEQTEAHDQQTSELARHKLGLHASEDTDGYRRHTCPAAAGKIHCPLRQASMALDRDRPEILNPPKEPSACCTQLTIIAGPEVAAKTRQKHDYPSKAWRISYHRRTGAERLNASIKDPATTTIARGWIRLFGVAPTMLFLACLLAARNQRTLASYQARQDDQARRAAAGKPPRARRRRRAYRAEPAPTPT